MCEGLAIVAWFKRRGGECFTGLNAPIELLEAGDQLALLAFEHLDVAVRHQFVGHGNHTGETNPLRNTVLSDFLCLP